MKYKLFSFSRYFLFLIILLPILTEYIEIGHLPKSLYDIITEVVLTIVIGAIVLIIYRQYGQLEKLSTLDHLTGIKNRLQLEIDLQREILRAKRSNIGVGLIFFDLNKFKEINDRYGHKEGDNVLIQFAQGLSKFARKGTDYCYRLGGDEFVILLTNLKNEQINDIENKIEERLKRDVFSELPDGVSASKGIALWRTNETYEDLLKRTDSIMYQAKKNSK